MAPRAIWRGVIAFDIVSVPVKFYPAVREEHISFNLLHDADETRLRQEMYCPAHAEPVAAGHVVRGYEVRPDRYVLIGEGELAPLEPEASRMVEVLDFVHIGDVDPRYFDRTYHLGPDGPPRGYATLVRALADTAVAGVCRWTMRKRNHLGALRASGGRLDMVMLRYGEQVEPAASLDLPQAEATRRELDAARALIEALSAEFDPAQYRDEYETRLRDLVARRGRGETVPLRRPKEAAPTPEEELPELLEKSAREVRRRRYGEAGD